MLTRAGLLITNIDRDRLEAIVQALPETVKTSREHARKLEQQLRHATVVGSGDIGSDVVTMNSRLRVRNVHTGRTESLTLVYPGLSDMFDTRLSVLTPLGTATLGARPGDVIEWRVPAGVRRLAVEQILYQPEAAGDFHL